MPVGASVIGRWLAVFIITVIGVVIVVPVAIIVRHTVMLRLVAYLIENTAALIVLIQLFICSLSRCVKRYLFIILLIINCLRIKVMFLIPIVQYSLIHIVVTTS